MLEFLKKPYPFNDDLRRNAKMIFFISISIFVFLLLFQPLEISSIQNREKFLLIVGLGVITFLALSLNLLILPSLLPNIFLKKEWIVWKEIFWNLWTLFIISFGYFLSYKTLGILEFDFYMMVKLILIAFFPLTLLIVFNQNRLLRLHLKTANELNDRLKESKHDQDKLVHFDSEYQKDKLLLKARLLLFIRSADNYIEVFWKDGNKINRRLVRSTLAKAQELLIDYNFIFKCHRSFIVNINFIDKVEGNSQGYKLFFEDIDFEIPVSKIAVDELKKKVSFL
ncbi:MAG: LytTR family transcriptional regulator [Salinivirgaceae bacterium]|nr:LytTR family transcriptional regulator [Salinivirgaceae bacterium]